METLAFAAALLDESGNILEYNTLFREAVNVPVDQMAPIPIRDIAPSDCHIPIAATFAALNANPDIANRRLDLSLQKPGGVLRQYRAAFSVLSRSPAPSHHMLLMMQLCDIDDIKAREQSLTDLVRIWNEAMTAAKIGIWDADVTLDSTTFSNMWRQLRGLKPEDPAPANHEEILKLVHPSDRALVIEQYQLQRQTGFRECQYEYRYKHRDGHWMWIECRGSRVQGVDGKATRIIGTDIDITARKLAEGRLALLSSRLQLAMEVTQIGVFEADFETGYTSWDTATRAIYGIDGDSKIKFGELWESMLHPEDRDRVLATIDEHIANLTAYDNQFRIIRPDGCIRYIHTRTLPFVDAEGHKWMIGANWDETDDILLRLDLERAKTLAEARNVELEKAKAEIERIALLDPLTGLPNRRSLDQWLDEFSRGGKTSQRGLAVLHIDLDRFKQINDTFGHYVGDNVLKHVAQLLLAEAGDKDRVFRNGGDEFVLIRLFDGDRAALEALASRLVDALRHPVIIEGHDCRFGASIGVAVAAGGDIDPQQMLLDADIGLYSAKSEGRNRWEYFSRESRERLNLTKTVSDDILRGLERDEFIPFYQLQFRADTLEIAGMETLARWNHPERGILTPDKFMDIAVEFDLIAEIDNLILCKALADYERLKSEGFDIPKYSVNVSASRLRDPRLSDMLAALPQKRGHLTFELLESIFLDDVDDLVAANIASIRKAGIAIEIDDFGSGHASITSLVRLRPEALKIDRHLVKPLPESNEQRLMVRAIIDMGHSLGVTVIGEGVETKDHAHWLRSLNCDLLQGFALARPMPADSVIGFVRRWRASSQPL